ncbi:MAG: S41 family peptidase [Clostridiales bacterium]|jgi:carboxyl-terminal processing protease|nr:S41 family peptidase [Clostridiales bacterium]
MKKGFLWIAVVVCLFTPISVRAEDAVLTDSDKTRLAGELLADVMDLLMERYVGEALSPKYLYESALRGMMDSLDPYSAYLTLEELDELETSFSGKMYGIGVTLDISDNNVAVISGMLPGSPAEASGLMKGDILLEVNKKAIKGLSLDEILAIIGESDTVTLKVQHETEVFEKIIQKQEIAVRTVASTEFEDILDSAKKRDNSALRYIVISEFGSETDGEFGELVTELRGQGVKRVIIDLRGNPGGYADSVIKICNRIVPKGPIMFTIDKLGNTMEIVSKLEEQPFEKIVVLTDQGTASAAEVLASALQDSKAAVIVGEKTYGKGVIQSLYPMPSGGALKFTTEEYLRRSGDKINKVGVTPDIPVTMPDLITESVVLNESEASDALPAVRDVLSYLGYKSEPGADAKVYDSALSEAVKCFQMDSGLTVNGELDANTLIKLNFAIYTAYSQSDKPLEIAYEILREGL